MVKDNTFGSILIDVIAIVVLVILAILCILPLWYTLCVSLSDKSAAAAGMVGLWPVGFNILSYRSIIEDANFFHAVWISVQRVGLGTICELVATLLMAYPLSRTPKQFAAQKLLYVVPYLRLAVLGRLDPLVYDHEVDPYDQ